MLYENKHIRVTGRGDEEGWITTGSWIMGDVRGEKGRIGTLWEMLASVHCGFVIVGGHYFVEGSNINNIIIKKRRRTDFDCIGRQLFTCSCGSTIIYIKLSSFIQLFSQDEIVTLK